MASTITFNGVSYSIPAVGDDGWGSDLSAYFIAIASGALQKTGGAFTLTAEANFGATYGLKSAYFKSQGTNPSSSGVMRLANAENISWRNQANNADLALSVNSSNNLQFNGANLLYAAAGLIVNADISPSAAIAYSKLNLTGSIVNADVSASAAISYSKLNLATSILNADINAAAAIAYSKLNLATSIVNADISGSAAIAYSKLNLATSVVNADIAAAAAIAYSKLAALTVSRALQTNSSTGFIEVSTVTNTELAYLSGVTSAIQTQLNARIANTLLTTTGDMVYASSANTPARLAVGSSGQVIKSVGGIPTWSTFSGGINYISSNPDAESDTTGWATYADAAATSPVDGTGGSPNSTWTRTTSSPLRGSGSFLFTRNSGASRQGEGVSYAFTIDTADKAKVLQVEFDYLLASGAFTAATSSTDSELTVWLYDVTNSLLIQPSSYKLLTSSTTIPDKFIGNFQTASNSTSYRLVIHCGSSTNAAFTMQFDNFKVGPCSYVYGTPITDWAVYTNPTTQGLGTLASTNLRWRRIGDSMQLQGGFITGTVTADVARLGLPSGATIGGTTSSRMQTGFVNRNGGTAVQMLAIQGNTYLTFGGGASSHGDVVGSSLFGSTEQLYFSTDPFPIQGWSSSVQMSDSYDGRLIAASYSSSVGTSVNGTPAVIPFATKNYDTTNSWNGSDTYTIPSAGKYSINAMLGFSNGSYTAGHYIEIFVFKNSTQIGGYTNGAIATGTAYFSAFTSVDVDCIAGDTIQIKGRNDAVRTLDTNVAHNYFNIKKIQSPTTISATETVAMVAEGVSSAAFGSNVTLPFNTPTIDTHGGWNSTNKDWAAPYSGIYKVFSQLRVTGTLTVNQYVDIIIQVDTVTKREALKYVENTGVSGYTVNTSWQGWLNAGQKIRTVGDTSIASPSLTTGATHTFMEIFRIK